MTECRAAIYARVSSERQADAGTIASQVAALRTRAAADGLALPAEREFLDDGYSGSTLVRPALERLRDLAAIGGVDRLYVHTPDRLARRYAYQVLLTEEFAAAGIEVVFLNRALGATPEDALLQQVQGVLAEYERALFLERSRRGKRHAAQAGSLSARPKAPYGYRYVGRQDGAAQPAYEVVPEEAQVVRQIFTWVAHERLTLAAVARRLREAGTPTATGKGVWGRSAVWALLRNPTYAGRAVYGMRRYGPWRPPLRPKRGHGAVPRHATTREFRPASEWITVPVPALVDEATFAAVQERLEENRQRARQRLDGTGTRHLLSGLVVCARCGYGYYGIRAVEKRRKVAREYRYYRCRGSDASRQGEGINCPNRAVYAAELEAAVWREVRQLLEHPERLAAEYQRRLAGIAGHDPQALDGLRAQLDRAKAGVARLIDGYADGLLTKEEFAPRLERLRQRVAVLEEQLAQQRAEHVSAAELQLAIGRLGEFAARVRAGLDNADRALQRELILALVRRVDVDDQQVRVVFKVSPPPPSVDDHASQHCPHGAEYEALQAARLRQETPAYKEAYARRAGIEGTLAQGIRVGDLRHSRYIGLARTHLQQIIIAVALNIIHTLAWLRDVPLAPTRVSRVAALAP
ncbi:MAG: recombinase family protein [Chloroflexota bacterium]|nr:recombinase family protein [Chloroflexota bacterium]